MEDHRQVLILGSMSSGTSSIAKALRQDMGLEVVHTHSDALWTFVRDGTTVSWFHGIQYWHNKHASHTIQELCKANWQFRKNRQNYGFGPTLFGTPDYNCSFLHPQFHKCHMHACQKSLRREFGCALSTTDDGNGGCATPFQTTLLQTRQPWRIVQSLVAKYCWKDDTSEILDPPPPQTLKWSLQAMGLLVTNNENQCVLQMMDYVMGYYNTILNSAPDIAVYAIESTSPCQVAHMAGLLDPSTTVYAPNYERVQQECSSGSHKDHHHHNTTNTSSSASPPQKSNVINRGRVSAQDLVPYTAPEHLKRLLALYARFEYEYSEE
jgi:hypothetical protein